MGASTASIALALKEVYVPLTAGRPRLIDPDAVRSQLSQSALDPPSCNRFHDCRQLLSRTRPSFGGLEARTADQTNAGATLLLLTGLGISRGFRRYWLEVHAPARAGKAPGSVAVRDQHLEGGPAA